MFAKSVTVTPDKAEAEDDHLVTIYRATGRSFYNTNNSTLFWNKVKCLIVNYIRAVSRHPNPVATTYIPVNKQPRK